MLQLECKLSMAGTPPVLYTALLGGIAALVTDRVLSGDWVP